MGKRKEVSLTQVEYLASRGLTQEQVAASLGISERTLRNRLNDSPEFAEAFRRGQAEGICAVSNVLFDHAMAGDMTAVIFFLKARAGWFDRPAAAKAEDVLDDFANGLEALRLGDRAQEAARPIEAGTPEEDIAWTA